MPKTTRKQLSFKVVIDKVTIKSLENCQQFFLYIFAFWGSIHKKLLKKYAIGLLPQFYPALVSVFAMTNQKIKTYNSNF